MARRFRISHVFERFKESTARRREGTDSACPSLDWMEADLVVSGISRFREIAASNIEDGIGNSVRCPPRGALDAT